MSKLEEFVRLFTKERIDELEFAYYINVFRYKDDEGKWEYGGYDAFADQNECRKWAEEYLTYRENNKNEILPVAKVSDIKKCWNSRWKKKE